MYHCIILFLIRNMHILGSYKCSNFFRLLLLAVTNLFLTQTAKLYPTPAVISSESTILSSFHSNPLYCYHFIWIYLIIVISFELISVLSFHLNAPHFCHFFCIHLIIIISSESSAFLSFFSNLPHCCHFI